MKTLNLNLMKKMVSYYRDFFSKVSSTEYVKRNILVLKEDLHYNEDKYLAEFVLVEGDEITLDKDNKVYLIPIYEHTFEHVDRVIHKRQESLVETGKMMKVPELIMDIIFCESEHE